RVGQSVLDPPEPKAKRKEENRCQEPAGPHETGLWGALHRRNNRHGRPLSQQAALCHHHPFVPSGSSAKRAAQPRSAVSGNQNLPVPTGEPCPGDPFSRASPCSPRSLSRRARTHPRRPTSGTPIFTGTKSCFPPNRISGSFRTREVRHGGSRRIPET